MPDLIRDVTRQGWTSRIGNSIVGALIGFVLFVVSFPLLFWNEGRAVKTAKSLAEGEGAVVAITADKVDAAHEGQLVHLTGQATTEEVLADPLFAISANAIKLQRQVEMYQWKQDERRETQNKLGGGSETVTTYTYTKTWADHAINSSQFRESSGHTNPTELPFPNTTKTAAQVTLGAFTLSPSLVAQINSFEELPVNDSHLAELAEDLRSRLKLVGGQFYQGQDAASPQVGDTRISFRVVKPTIVSFVSQQVGSSFQPYRAAAGGQIERLMAGTKSAQEIFAQLELENTLWTWGLRLGGFLAIAFGIGMMLGPLGVLGDVIPFIGNILRLGAGLVAGMVAAALSLITISIAWLTYRPLFAAILVILALAAVILLKKLASRPKIAPA